MDKKRNKMKNNIDKVMKMNTEELRNHLFTKDGKPKCTTCGKPMVNAYDSILKKKSKYLWEWDCDCNLNKNFRLSVG